MLEGEGESLFSAELAAAVHLFNLILVCISPLSSITLFLMTKSFEKSIVYFIQELMVLLRYSSITCNLSHLDPLSV